MHHAIDYFRDQDWNSFTKLHSTGLTKHHIALVYRPLLNFPIGLHYGLLVYMDDRFVVIHLDKNSSARISSVDEFCAGHELTIEEKLELNPLEVVERVKFANANLRKYSLIANNCEDFARYLFKGSHISHQIVAAAVLIGIAVWSRV